jgi:hypothetical protein
MTSLRGWALVLGLVACTNGGKDETRAVGKSPVPAAPNAAVEAAPSDAAVVPPVTDGKGFTLVYTHNMDGEIEPCG